MKNFLKHALFVLCVFSMVFGFVGCPKDVEPEPPTPGSDPVELVVELSATELALAPGGTAALTLVKGEEVLVAEWESDDPTVASYSEGVVTAKKVGEATITATYEGKTYNCIVTVSDISLPINITLSNDFVEKEFGTLKPAQSKVTGIDNKYNTWDTNNTEIRTSTGLYVYAEASGLIKNPDEGDNLVTYYYAGGSEGVVGETLGVNKSYIALYGSQLATRKTSVKVTVNAHGTQIDSVDETKGETPDKKYGTIGIVNSDKLVLAKSAKLTAEPTDYVFYVTPGQKLIIKNIGGDGTNVSFNSIKAEESDEPVTANGTIPVTGITLDKETLDGIVGSSAQLVATVSPADATAHTLVWETSNDKVVTVDEEGTVSYVGAGSATITVSCGEVKAECAVTVVEASKPVTSIAIDETLAIDLYESAGATINANVLPVDTDATSVAWTIVEGADLIALETTSTALAEGKSSVKVTAKAVGTARVKATAGDFEDECTITITSSGAKGTYDLLTLAKDPDEIYNAKDLLAMPNGITPDGTIEWENLLHFDAGYGVATDKNNGSALTVKVAGDSVISFNGSQYSNGTVVVTDTAGNEVLASKATKMAVDKSEFAFIYEGEATTLTLTFADGVTYIDNFTVIEKTTEEPCITSIAISGADSVVVGSTLTLSADVVSKYFADPSVTWSSKDEAIATVDENGVVSGVAAGTVIITATSVFDSTKLAEKEVRVSADVAWPIYGQSYTYDLESTEFAALIGSSTDTFVSWAATATQNHGIQFTSGNTMTIRVAGPADISLVCCKYANKGQVTVTAEDGTVVASDVVVSNKADDGGDGTCTTATTINYTGTATLLTFTFTNTAYIHGITVAPVVEDVTYDLTSAEFAPLSGTSTDGLVSWAATATQNHGIQFTSGNTMSIRVAGPVDISLVCCKYANKGQVTVTAEDGTVVASDVVVSNKADDGGDGTCTTATTINYTGTATLLTFTFTNTAYIHGVTVDYAE